MISFLQTLDNSDLRNKNSQMIEPTFSSNPYIGLGFQLGDINSKKTIGHYGGDKRFRSYLVMIPEKKLDPFCWQIVTMMSILDKK